MSPKPAKSDKSLARRAERAALFAALGDETRLSLISKLADGKARSISELSDDHKLSRQAITKHLRVLENVGMVHNMRSGRESMFAFDARPLDNLKDYLDVVSDQWGDALERLKAFLED